MGSMNKVILVGNLGRDAELRYTQSGTAVANFNMATTETWRDRETQEQKERTEWHRIVLWGKVAEALKDYLVKGKQVLVEGQLQTRKWQDKDGKDRYTTEVRGDKVVLLGSKGDSAPRARTEDEQPARNDDAGAQPGMADDDIPF